MTLVCCSDHCQRRQRACYVTSSGMSSHIPGVVIRLSPFADVRFSTPNKWSNSTASHGDRQTKRKRYLSCLAHDVIGGFRCVAANRKPNRYRNAYTYNWPGGEYARHCRNHAIAGGLGELLALANVFVYGMYVWSPSCTDTGQTSRLFFNGTASRHVRVAKMITWSHRSLCTVI